MTESPRCPKCGIQLPADAPAGLCPKCLVQAGFESQPMSASAEPGPTKLTPPASGFVPPTVEELAPLFPQLEILELLGKGGMGAVYKARQPGLDRLVAVKILPPEISHDPAFAERFQREARALARLSHPHIVAVYDFGETLECGGLTPPSIQLETTSGTAGDDPKYHANAHLMECGVKPPHSRALCYIVMEFVDGANLRQATQTKTLTSAEALAIVPQICEALQFAHDEGIVHRDIKPENILIDKRGRVKIADFGLAKLLGTDASDHSLTATHQVMGTLRYMAPEQMQGSREVDHRADIYSLGVVFYELLTGELPMGRFAPPSKKVQIDVRLDEIVLRALEADPEQRYQHASEVKTELDSIRTTAAPTPQPAELKDPLDAFRNLLRFAMTPQPGYAKQVALPMLVLFVLWVAATIMAHVVYGQKENYREGPILLVQGGGMFLYVVIVLVLNVRFTARKRTVGAALTPEPIRLEIRQQDAKELLSLVLSGLYVMSIAGWGLAIYGMARVIADGTVTESLPSDVLTFFWILAGSIVAHVVVHKAWAQGRDRLARIGALDLVAVGGLMSFVISRWYGMPSWLGLIYSLVAFGGYLMLCGKDVSAALRALADQPRPPRWISSEPRFSRFAIAGAVWALFGLLAIIPTLYFIGLNRVWNGTALPTDVIHSEPPLSFSIFMGALLVIGAGAPIGTTIYGAIAIGHIKRSGGKIIGLPLAVADVLFFPLLVLSGLIAALIARVGFSMAPHPNAADVTSAGAIGVLAALVVSFFVARAVWRAVAGTNKLGDQLREVPVPATTGVNPSNSIDRISLWAAISGVVVPALLLLGGIVLSSRVSIPDGFVAVCFLLGVGIELVAIGCGIVSRNASAGKAGLIIGSISLVLWLATLLTIPMRRVEADRQPEVIIQKTQ